MSCPSPHPLSRSTAAALLAAASALGCADSKPPPVALPEAPLFLPEGALPQLTPLALLVPDSEIARLLKAGGKRTGQLRLSGGNRGALWVQTKAAQQGATHIALTQSQMSTLRRRGPTEPATYRCQQSASGYEAMLTNEHRCEQEAPVGEFARVSLQSFQLITVPVEHWELLPESLRPRSVQGQSKERLVPVPGATVAD